MKFDPTKDGRGAYMAIDAEISDGDSMQQALFAQVRKKIDSLRYTMSYSGGYTQFITDLRIAYQEGAELGVHFDDKEKIHHFHEAIPQEGVFWDYT